MLHLPADRLAELVDVEPTPQELAHLQSCAICARERNSYLALRQLAIAERERAAEPLVAWEALRRDLIHEGMIVTTGEQRPVVTVTSQWNSRFNVTRWSLRIAASFLLLAAGVAAGRMTAPQAVDPDSAPEIGAPTASSGQAPSGVQFTSSGEAMAALMRAQEDYQRAAAFLLASDTTLGPNTPALYKQRLAALDELMGVTRSALTRVPHDPVINSYYLAALGAREATLQQLELSLPEGTRIDRF